MDPTEEEQPVKDSLCYVYGITWQQLFKQIFPPPAVSKDQMRDWATKLGQVLGAAYAPLSVGMLTRLIEVTDHNMLWLLQTIQCFITSSIDPNAPCVRKIACAHPSIQYYFSGVLGVARPDQPPRAIDGHQIIVNAYKQGHATWADVNWENWEKPDQKLSILYAAHYLAEHAFQARQFADSNWIGSYIDLMTSPGFRQLRRDHAGKQAAMQDMRRALQVYYVWATAKGDSASIEQALEAAEHLLVTRRYDEDAHLLTLEDRLRNSKPYTGEKKPLQWKPLYDYWNLYYPRPFAGEHFPSASSEPTIPYLA